jgi:hypothetical protein
MFKLEKLQGTLTNFVEKINEGELEAIDKKYASKRHSLLGEVLESAMVRRAPGLSKCMDLLSTIGIKSKDPEILPWQDEFEKWTSLTMFIPDFLLHFATDPVLKLPGFKKLIKIYPLGGDAKKKILEAQQAGKPVDPDDVINFLRIVNQDITLGKLSIVGK